MMLCYVVLEDVLLRVKIIRRFVCTATANSAMVPKR